MNRALSRHRAEQAERMQASGATWAEVGKALGYSNRGSAQRAVQRLRASAPPESVEQVRAQHDTALRILQQNMFGRFLRAVQNGDDDTVTRYAKEIRSTVTERAKMVGAYAPERTEVDVNVSTSATAIIDRMEAELLALAAGRQPQRSNNNIIEGEVVE